MKTGLPAFGLVVGLCATATGLLAVRPGQEELRRLTARLLAPPALSMEPGFKAQILVPPGNMYDPLWMLPRGNAIWINDDGGEEDGKGSRLLTINRNGRFSVMAGIGTLLPVTGFDVAPASFGPAAA